MQIEDAEQSTNSSIGQFSLRPSTPWWAPAVSGGAAPDAIGAKASGEERPGPFVALLIFTFILVVSPQSFFPWLGTLRPAWLAAAAGVGLLLLDRIPRGKPLLISDRETWAAMGLLGWATITVPFSLWPGGSYSTLTQEFSKTLIVFWLLGFTVNTAQRLSTVAWSLSLMSIPLAYVGITNYLSGHFIAGGNRIAGYQGALTGNPNDLALMLNLTTPLALGLFASSRQLLSRLLLLGVVTLNVLTVVYTSSRGGFVTIVALWVFYAWKLSRRGKAGWPIGLLVVVLLSIPLLPEGYLSRLSTITHTEEDETGSAQARREGMTAGIHYVLEHPFIGAGIGMNELALNDVVGPTWRKVHNVFLEYGTDLGVPGLALFLMLVVGALRSTMLACRRSASVPELRRFFYISEGLQGSLCAFIVGASFAPVAYNFYFYYFAGLAIGARRAIGVGNGQAEHSVNARIRSEQRTATPSLRV